MMGNEINIHRALSSENKWPNLVIKIFEEVKFELKFKMKRNGEDKDRDMHSH